MINFIIEFEKKIHIFHKIYTKKLLIIILMKFTQILKTMMKLN